MDDGLKGRIRTLLEARDTEGLGRLFEALPPFHMSEAARAMLSDPQMHLTAVDLAGMHFCKWGPFELGRQIAGAVTEVGRGWLREGRLGKGYGILLPTVRSAEHEVAALEHLGAWSELIGTAQAAIDYFRQFEAPADLEETFRQRGHLSPITTALRDLELAIVRACIADNDLQRALDRFATLQAQTPEAEGSLEMDRVGVQLLQRIQQATDLAGEGEPKIDIAYFREQFLASIEEIRSSGLRAFTPLAELLAARFGDEAMSDEEFSRRGGDLLDRMLPIIGRGGEAELFRIQRRIRQATSIFRAPQPPDASRLRASQGELEQALSWCLAHDQSSDVEFCLWGLYLCHSRLGEFSIAADHLKRLRGMLDTDRRSLDDPVDRAGVYRRFPHLSSMLAKCLYRSGRTVEMLEAIEVGKGRLLEDLLFWTSEDSSLTRPLDLLPQCLRQASAHYLAYFVEEDEIYAVLLASDGSHHARDIRIDQASLRASAGRVWPRTWGEIVDPGAPEAPMPLETLAPLVSWLDDLVEQGVIEPDDHICYSPHLELHHIPLHYLPFRGAPLARSFSVSRVFGAGMLVALLSQPPPRPRRWTAVTVNDRADDPEMQATFAEVPLRWATHTEDVYLEGLAATVEAVEALPFAGRVVHLATHGIFPHRPDDPEPNPMKSSGLVLATPSGLPDLDSHGEGNDFGLLAPERWFRDRPRASFAGSHLSLQACVTGLAKAGAGGDALGLELAAFLCGLSSSIGTHWNVQAQDAARFFGRFYDAWLGQGCSRGRAWVLAVRAGMDEAAGPEGMEQWAAFSLAGDFR